jgi:RimJ/RimL family protein N-acetyltransferase
MSHSDVFVPNVFNLDRIQLRRQRQSDAEALFECVSDFEVARYMDWPLATSVDQIAGRIAERDELWAAGKEFYWVITEPQEDRAVGAISCRVDEHCVDFGFFVHRRYWGKGYATEAAQAIVDWARRHPTIRRVWATCDVDNVASAHVLEKVGLSREATLRRAIVRPNLSNEPRDALVYSLLSG